MSGRLNDAPDFERIVLKADAQDGGRITRLSDVGRVELGAQTYSQSFTLDGKPAAGLGISQLPEANAIAVAGAVRARMEELARPSRPGSSTGSRSTPPGSSRPRSTRSTPRCSRRPSSCSSSS